MLHIQNTVPKPIQLRVGVIKQTSGAFEHVVIFDADIHLLKGNPSVKIISLPPMSTDEWVMGFEKIAISQIVKGIEDVLVAYKLGASVSITRLKIHPVDFIARKFREYTAFYLREALCPLN